MNSAISVVNYRQLCRSTWNLRTPWMPEALYLATSEDVQGLVGQGRTVAETVEIAREVARKLLEAQSNLRLPKVKENFDYPLIIGGA